MSSNVTQILRAISAGQPQGAEDLLPLVYDELRRLAVFKIAQEKPGQTLQATALVHEAYLSLVDVQSQRVWQDRKHFYNCAAEAMRRILIDNARRKRGIKHGEGKRNAALDNLAGRIEAPPTAAVEDVLDVNDALDKLAVEDPESADLVKLHYFAGLTLQEIADMLELNIRTVERNWAYARTWLCHHLNAYAPQ